MQVFGHHLYEYRKGLRNLVLHTMDAADAEIAIRRLKTAGIDHVGYAVGKSRMNLFFGAAECVQVIRRIGKPDLKEYTPEEDFILGIMLGYERRKQCERYLVRKKREKPVRLCRCAEKGACAHG